MENIYTWKETLKYCQKFTFLADERQGPGEDVHEVGEPVGVGAAVELPDVHHVVLVF